VEDSLDGIAAKFVGAQTFRSANPTVRLRKGYRRRRWSSVAGPKAMYSRQRAILSRLLQE